MKSCIPVLGRTMWKGSTACSLSSFHRSVCWMDSFAQNTHASFYNTEDNSPVLTEVLNHGQLAVEEGRLLSVAFGSGSRGTCYSSLQYVMLSTRTSLLL